MRELELNIACNDTLGAGVARLMGAPAHAQRANRTRGSARRMALCDGVSVAPRQLKQRT